MTRERPNGNLFSFKVLVSLGLHITILVLVQLICFFLLKMETWYIHIDPGSIVEPTVENTVIYLLNAIRLFLEFHSCSI
jgi:hypothetical protein